MTYRELIRKLMQRPSEVLDQKVVIYNEEDERFYGCTGSDVVLDEEVPDSEDNKAGIDIDHFFQMVNI